MPHNCRWFRKRDGILDPTGNGFKYYEVRNNINSGAALGAGCKTTAG
jgi:hypothetical protein